MIRYPAGDVLVVMTRDLKGSLGHFGVKTAAPKFSSIVDKMSWLGNSGETRGRCHSSMEMTVQTEPLLAVQGFTCRFGEIVANDGVDFDVRAGEVHALVGENGAGKSTLLKLVYGVYQPDEGELRLDGEPAEIS